jgi:hypothetical protein
MAPTVTSVGPLLRLPVFPSHARPCVTARNRSGFALRAARPGLASARRGLASARLASARPGLASAREPAVLAQVPPPSGPLAWQLAARRALALLALGLLAVPAPRAHGSPHAGYHHADHRAAVLAVHRKLA